MRVPDQSAATMRESALSWLRTVCVWVARAIAFVPLFAAVGFPASPLCRETQIGFALQSCGRDGRSMNGKGEEQLAVVGQPGRT
ncbi:hypothetical protein V8E36_007161 [Tilletia maclaganii]